MNVLPINNLLQGQMTFQAEARGVRKVRGGKPNKLDEIFIQRERYLNTEGNSKNLLEAKIKYAEKRLASEQEYLAKVHDYVEKRYVAMTIGRLKQELDGFKRALAKVVTKKV